MSTKIIEAQEEFVLAAKSLIGIFNDSEHESGAARAWPEAVRRML